MGSVVFDGVLGSDHKVGIWQRMGRAVDAHRLFTHRLEQGRLTLWIGSVDLVCEHYICEQWARLEAKTLASSAVGKLRNRDAGEIAGQEVAGELHAMKIRIDGAGGRSCQRRLAHAGDIFDQ